MVANAIAISRGLVDAGIDPKAADAIAEAVVTHSDDSHATKSDIAELRGNMNAQFAEVKAQIKLIMALGCGLFIGIAVIIVDRLVG